MRSTVTLDEDIAQQIKILMAERGAGFKETINDLLRRGLQATSTSEPYEAPTFRSGVRQGVDLSKALSMAARLEDDEFVRKVELGK